jgi:hypothetical protein
MLATWRVFEPYSWEYFFAELTRPHKNDGGYSGADCSTYTTLKRRFCGRRLFRSITVWTFVVSTIDVARKDDDYPIVFANRRWRISYAIYDVSILN